MATRKKRGRYKLVQPVGVEPAIPPRVRAAVIIIQWAFYFAMAGVIIAFLLILSLYTHWRVSAQWWLNLWPASVRLLSATNLTQSQMTHTALWASVENGLVYGLIGILLGGVHVGFSALRRRWS